MLRTHMGVIIPITRNFTMLKVTISKKREEILYIKERENMNKGSYKKNNF
jgi:hypothetical protein